MKSSFSTETSMMYVERSGAADCITMALCHTVNTRTVDYYGGKNHILQPTLWANVGVGLAPPAPSTTH